MADRVHVLVTVSRSWTNWPQMFDVLNTLWSKRPGAVLIHGDAPRGDRVAADMWEQLGGETAPCPADWGTCAEHCPPGHRKVARVGREYCPTAGHRRNDQMVDAHPDLCVAFLDPKSKTRGAQSTADKAERAGIPTVRYNQETSR